MYDMIRELRIVLTMKMKPARQKKGVEKASNKAKYPKKDARRVGNFDLFVTGMVFKIKFTKTRFGVGSSGTS